MNSMYRIAVVSHALAVPVCQNRWKRLAREDGYEIHLLVPARWEQNWFGERVVYVPEEVHEGNFHVHPIETTSLNDWKRYLFRSRDAKLGRIRPDLIYVIHEESVWIHYQIYLYRRLFVPTARIIFFSMNALGVPYTKETHPLKRLVYKLMWRSLRANTEAALVHYPGCLKSLRRGAYRKPVYLQTQIGVDETIFRPNAELRERYRRKLRFEGRFVVGYAGRLTADKGVDDLFRAFVELAPGNAAIAMLLVGNGELRENLEVGCRKAGLRERVQITGFVDQADVPAYMNAMDTLVLGSRTTPHWIDTFPLVTVQAQATGVPVIASDSAAIPWQLGETARLYPEGNIEELKKALLEFLNNEDIRNSYARRGRERSLEYFCHESMTSNFKAIVDQVMSGEFVYHGEGEDYQQWKAY